MDIDIDLLLDLDDLDDLDDLEDLEDLDDLDDLDDDDLDLEELEDDPFFNARLTGFCILPPASSATTLLPLSR